MILVARVGDGDFNCLVGAIEKGIGIMSGMLRLLLLSDGDANLRRLVSDSVGIVILGS